MRTVFTGRDAEVIRDICAYDGMKGIVETTPDAIKETFCRLTSPPAMKLDGMPKAQNPFAGEEQLVNGIYRLDELRKRYRDALVFLAWFEPMWNRLTDDERELLETYRHMDRYNGAIAGIAKRQNYSPRQVNRNRLRALSRLRKLLYAEL